MKVTEHNSIAALLGTLVHLVMWAALVFSLLILVFLGLGFVASLNGGQLSFPMGDTLTGGIRPELFIAALASFIVVMPGIIYICIQMRLILKTLAEGDPFVPENAPRLLRVAIAIASMELARYGVILLLMSFIRFGEGGGPHFSVSLTAWVSAAAMLVFSQVFREGSRLREEEKMTV